MITETRVGLFEKHRLQLPRNLTRYPVKRTNQGQRQGVQVHQSLEGVGKRSEDVLDVVGTLLAIVLPKDLTKYTKCFQIGAHWLKFANFWICPFGFDLER